MELIHIGGLILFVVRFLAIFKKHPNILLDRTPTNRYSDDGENDRDIKISSLSNPYEQMYWPSVDFSKLCTAARRKKKKRRGINLFHDIYVWFIFSLWNCMIWNEKRIQLKDELHLNRMHLHLLIIFFELATSNEAIIVPHLEMSTVESLWM